MIRVACMCLVLTAACGNGETEKLRIKPKNAPSEVMPPNQLPLEQCPPIAVSITRAGVWVGTARDRTFAAACDGATDVSAVAIELCDRRRGARCSAIEVATVEGTPYQTVLAITDAAIAAGFDNVGLTEPSTLAVSFPDEAAAADVAPPGCGKPVAACERQQ